MPASQRAQILVHTYTGDTSEAEGEMMPASGGTDESAPRQYALLEARLVYRRGGGRNESAPLLVASTRSLY